MKNSEMNKEIAELKIYRDKLLAPMYFQELLGLAEEVCLTHSPEYPDSVYLEHEGHVVASIGTRGLKNALDIVHDSPGLAGWANTENVEYEDEAKRPIVADTPTRSPEYFTDSVDPLVLAKAEIFGSAMIEESFKVLGQDAYQKVEQYKAATTPEQQMVIIDWLNDRLHNIAISKRDIFAPSDPDEPESDNIQLYHPIRLSPKAIGVYPNIAAPPTCLGVSIIAAGFFNKVGAPYMHANVARSAKESAGIDTWFYLDNLREKLNEKFGIIPPETIMSAVGNLTDEVWSDVTREEAHHTAVYAQLLDGSWAQFDSNYQVTKRITTEDDNLKLSKSYNSLLELAVVAPGIEIAQTLNGYVSESELAYDYLNLQDASLTTAIAFEAYRILSSDNSESIPQKIYDECVKLFFNRTSDNKRLGLASSLLTTGLIRHNGGVVEESLQHYFYKNFEKYVLWGEDISTFHSRLQNDPRYLINRALDVATLPFLMLASVGKDEAKNGGYDLLHRTIELGLPDQRIGLAVLSDFASFTESPLTSSFWLSHWPGYVSPIEVIEGASHSSHDDSLIYNNLVYLGANPLTSLRNKSIVESFLNIRAESERQENGKDGPD